MQLSKFLYFLSFDSSNAKITPSNKHLVLRFVSSHVPVKSETDIL